MGIGRARRKLRVEENNQGSIEWNGMKEQGG
jgi:hypothetical protein